MTPALILPSELPPDMIWGPPLDDYLDRPEANLDFARIPEEEAIYCAIEDLLYNPETVTFSTLETIMTIVYRPRLLSLLVHQNAVASCMELVEKYVARNGQNSNLFEHAFGFLSLHVLSLVLQAGLLSTFDNWLEELPMVLSEDTSWLWDPKAPAIQGNFVIALSQSIYGTILHPSGLRRDGPLVINYKIEWYESSVGDERACLPAVGGFMFRDAEFILRQLFNHRNTFLKCCYRTRSPGWSIFVFMIQLMLDDKSYTGSSVPQLWQKHRDIAYRYSLVSGDREDVFVETICCRYSECYIPTFQGRSTATGFEDAQLIQLAYTRKFRPNEEGTHKRQLGYGTHVTYYVRDSVDEYSSLLLAMSETATEVVWDTILCVGQKKDDRWTEVDVFMGGSYYSICRRMLKRDQPDLIAEFIKILHKFKIIDMFGRYLLLPSFVRNNLPGFLDDAPPSYDGSNVRHAGLRIIKDIGGALGGVHGRAETPKILDDYFPDWYKTLVFLDRDRNIYRKETHLYHIAVESESAWVLLGMGLGYLNHLQALKPSVMWEFRRCTYVRCPDAECARFETGSGKRFCGIACQAAYARPNEFNTVRALSRWTY